MKKWIDVIKSKQMKNERQNGLNENANNEGQVRAKWDPGEGQRQVKTAKKKGIKAVAGW